MSDALKTKLKTIAFAMLLLVLAACLLGFGITGLLDLREQWGDARLYFGSSLFAMPVLGLFNIAIAILFVRAALQGRAPVELMTGRFMRPLAIAAGSLVLAPIGGLMISERLTAAGYTRCEQLGYPGRMASGYWAKNAAACDDRHGERA